jgi:hypothetical protein
MSKMPEGVNLEYLNNLQKRGDAAREKEAKAAHQDMLQRAYMHQQGLSSAIEQLGVDEQRIKEAVDAKRTSLQQQMNQRKPPSFTPRKGHNSARYAPFDFQWDSINCGGITSCSLYGPDAELGLIGADLASYNAGGGASNSGVGFWYNASAEGTMFVDVQAYVWGVGYVYSALFGYAQAYAGLRVYVEEYSGGNLANVYQATTDIYNDSGVVVVDVTDFNWEIKNVTISVPVQANTWYAIWGTAVQNAYAGGIADAVSNFEMYIGPITYNID